MGQVGLRHSKLRFHGEFLGSELRRFCSGILFYTLRMFLKLNKHLMVLFLPLDHLLKLYVLFYLLLIYLMRICSCSVECYSFCFGIFLFLTIGPLWMGRGLRSSPPSEPGVCSFKSLFRVGNVALYVECLNACPSTSNSLLRNPALRR